MKQTIYFLLFFSFLFPILGAEQKASTEKEFSKGYFYSKLEDRFPDEEIQFDIQNHKIIFYVFPNDVEVCKNIQLYIETFPDYYVVFDRSYQSPPDLPCEQEPGYENSLALEPFKEEGNWLPELNPFFPTMLAQPHIVGYSAGYRTYDKTFKISCLPVSIGDQFSLYQIRTQSYGRLYIGIEACVWAIFEAKAQSLSLINADYYIALPLTYIHNKFSMRLRVFHESSHLGDEFLLENKKIVRLNPSMEVVDLFLSYNFMDRLTGFVGISRILRSDESFKIKPHGIYYGFNYFLNFCKLRVCNLEAIPYIATYFTNLEDNKWKVDSSLAIGYQWDKLYGHKFRVYLEAHEGYSHEGQFSKKRTRYLALKILYGY